MVWLIALGFISGIITGSFVKATAERIIRQSSILGRSYCLSCKKQLKWYDLFPVLSYLLLRGKCRFCGKRIPLPNLFFEIALGVIFSIIFAQTLPAGFSPMVLLELFFKIFVVSVLAIIFWVDLVTGLIPDKVTYPASLIAGGYLLLSTALQTLVFYQNLVQNPFGKYLLPPYSAYFTDAVQRLFLSSLNNVWSGVVSALIFSSIIILTRGKGMGWGDVKYVLFLGLALGFPNIAVGLFLSFLLGAVFALFLILLGKKHFGQTIPFGPFLSLGALVALLWGNQLFNWYLNNFKF